MGPPGEGKTDLADPARVADRDLSGALRRPGVPVGLAAGGEQRIRSIPLSNDLRIHLRTGLVRRGPMADDIAVSVRVFTILVAGLMFTGSARADEAPPPSFFTCAGKSPGDACEGDSGAGVCVASTCSRLDYSKGSPPETVSRDCLKCQPPTPPAQSVVATPAQSPPATAPAPEAKGACQIGPGAGAPALFLLALAMVRRRRYR